MQKIGFSPEKSEQGITEGVKESTTFFNQGWVPTPSK